MKTKRLSVCSRNQWRSPAAEALFKNHPRYEARSAGPVNGARLKLKAGRIGGADIIFCSEKKPATLMEQRFASEFAYKPLIVLRIPDHFGFMTPALIALLRTELSPHLDLCVNCHSAIGSTLAMESVHSCASP
ncbi:MAG: protein tyrosine phosphatase [Opitutaceae bacterium]